MLRCPFRRDKLGGQKPCKQGDLGCDVDHGGEDGHTISVLARWIEGDDLENLEEKNISETAPLLRSAYPTA